MKIFKKIKERARTIAIARQVESADQQQATDQLAVFYGLITLFFLGYATLFYFITQYDLPFDFPKQRIAKLASCVGSSVHGIALFIVSLLYLLGRVNLVKYRNLLCISIAYFIFDFTIIPTYTEGSSETIYMIMHHAAVLFCITGSCTRCPDGFIMSYPHLIAQGFLSEITAPFTYACWFLLKVNKGDTALFLTLSIFALVIWAIARVINFTLICRALYKQKPCYLEHLLLIPFLFVVIANYYWFVKLLIKAIALIL